MNQFTLFIKTAILSAFLVAGLTASAQSVVFSDSFNDLTQGTFSNQDSTGMSNPFPANRKGWNTAKSSQVYYGATVVRIGARKAPGFLQTDTMNLSGNFQLTFNGYAWAYDANNMDILLNGKLLQTVTFPNGPISSVSDLLNYSVNGTGTGKDVIQFLCKYQSNRILISDITFTSYPSTPISSVFSGNNKAPFAQNGILFIQTQTSQSISIYTATGMMVRSLMSNAGTNTVSLSQGLYLVKIGDKVYKVVVN